MFLYKVQRSEVKSLDGFVERGDRRMVIHDLCIYPYIYITMYPKKPTRVAAP